MEQRFRNVDAFSGQGAIARAFKGRGYRVARLDIELSPLDDTQMNPLYSFMYTTLQCYMHVTMAQSYHMDNFRGTHLFMLL